MSILQGFIAFSDSASLYYIVGKSEAHVLIWHDPSYYVQICQPKCQISEKTEYFEYAITVLKQNLFCFINLSGIYNVILQGKVEDNILDEARQRHYRKIAEFRDMELRDIK